MATNTTTTIKTISIDLGIRNMAYFISSSASDTTTVVTPISRGCIDVLEYGTVKTMRDLVDVSIRAIDAVLMPHLPDTDYVIIEAQPRMIKKMDLMEIGIYTHLRAYFRYVRGMVSDYDTRVILYSPKKKLTLTLPQGIIMPDIVVVGKGKGKGKGKIKKGANRQQNKDMGISLTTQLLQYYDFKDDIIFINSIAKKDDYCDAFLQALKYYEEYWANVNKPVKKRKRVA